MSLTIFFQICVEFFYQIYSQGSEYDTNEYDTNEYDIDE